MVERPQQKLYSFTEAGVKFLVELPETYDSIAPTLGLTSLGNNYEADDSDVAVTVSDSLRVGRGIRIRITYRGQVDQENGPTITVAKSSRIFCPISKAETALKTLKSKTYKNLPITGAGIPRRRRLG